MKNLYITRHTNGRLVLCTDITKKNGKTSTLYLSWQLIHLYLTTPDRNAMEALKVGERQVIV